MPDNSVDLVLTSPPFLRLRSYLPEGHPDKGKEIGSEPNPAVFIDTLLALSAEWDRVLTPHGSLCVELGDTYSGSGGAGGDYNDDGFREGQPKFEGSARKGSGWPDEKSACLIPELFRVALAYGINPLTGVESPAGRWRVRNTVRWVKPNPTPGALGDKFRTGTSEMVVACKSKDRWFDLDAVRVINNEDRMDETGFNNRPKGLNPNAGFDDSPGSTSGVQNPNGAPPLDWWKITAKGYKGAHYAVFPPELCKIPIESMCPREVCTGCGEPRRRIVETAPGQGGVHPGNNGGGTTGYGKGHRSVRTVLNQHWSVCGCETPVYRPGIVLDPFGGSGTTGAVATGMNRDAILIDLDDRNIDLARERIGMFMVQA